MRKGLDSEDRQHSSHTIVLLDLIVIVGVVLVTLGLIYWGPPWSNPLRLGFGFVSLLFVPGYVTLAALMTDIDTRTRLTPWKRVESGLNRAEQVILSVICSIAIVPILGIAMNYTSFGVQPVPMVHAVSGYALLVACIAALRRPFSMSTVMSVLLDDINSLPFKAWTSRLHSPLTETDLILNLLIIVVILIGGIVVVAPPPEQNTSQFTEFSVLNGADSGDLTMNEYLQSSGPADAASVQIEITNHEQQSIEYTVIVQVQRAEVRERSVTVLDQRQISTIDISLESGESARLPYEFTSPETATECRVAFLLYQGTPPNSPTVDNAYRELHLWDTADPPPDQTGCPNLGAINGNLDQAAVTSSAGS